MGRLAARVLALFWLGMALAQGAAGKGGTGPEPTGPALPEGVARALKAAGLPESHVGIVVQDLDSDTPALALGEQRALNPASVMKLVTTLAALDSLGPAQVWQTRVWVDGEVRDGVLRGDLILQGGGDPALTRERFGTLLREVRDRGIRAIQGDLILDGELYALDPLDSGSFDAAPLKPYNALPAALLVNHNSLYLRLDGQGGARLEPPALGLDNRLSLDPLAPCDDPDAALELTREDEALRLAGRYPQACGERLIPLNLMCPAATATAWFTALWRELGGTWTGQARVGTPPAAARLWLEFASPPLSGIVRDINKYSNNVMAKMLFLNLGVARYGGRADWAKGERAVRQWLAERGLDIPGLVLDNGSGLSRSERISAVGLVRLLRWAARQPLYYEFAASLPALGLEGTARRRLAGSPQAGRAWLKTGSLNGSRALAGYVLDSGGRRRVLVFMANHPSAGYAVAAQERLLEWAIGPALP